LRSFPFDQLKIDRSFVRDAPERADLRAIIRGVATIADGMGMRTTAEGVETAEQMAAVRELGCTSVQGYLLGRPMAAEAISALVGQGSVSGPERHSLSNGSGR
jgi:EAL domain-containing protein (putative c-di-GMP-specific phosphodiesterase class I)